MRALRLWHIGRLTNAFSRGRWQRSRPGLSSIFVALMIVASALVVVPLVGEPSAEAAVEERTNTVEFFAGQDTGTSPTNENVKNDFATQTFQLAESGVDVVDAYVEVFANIGMRTAKTYSSSYVYFDMCTPACSPSTAAFTSTGSLNAHKTDESQYVRLRANVTSETDLAAYAGGGAVRNFAVGYCFATGASCSGTQLGNIFTAHAKLVVTYKYTKASANRTNSVLYPLESASETGSKTATQGPCTINDNCPKFSYNAEIPEISSQISQHFNVHFLTDQNNNTSIDFTPQVDGHTSGSVVRNDGWLSNQGGLADFRASGLDGYANNTAQQLEIGVTGTGGNTRVLGGENSVTYTHSANAATKTKTVSYPVGEVITAMDQTSKSSLTGPTVYLPESGVTVKKAWFRINTSYDDQDENLSITAKVGSRSETSATTYSLKGDGGNLADDGHFIHIIPSTEYAELAGATATSGKAVQMTADWGDTAPGGHVTAELMITYQFTGESSGYQTTQQLFAGQQTSAGATSWSTSSGAIAPSIPEPVGSLAIRGAHLLGNFKARNPNYGENIGVNLTTGSCTASATSQGDMYNNPVSMKVWKDVTGTVTTSPSQTYTACYASSEASVVTGVLTITYQWTNSAPSPAPSSLAQTLTDTTPIAVGGSTTDTSIRFAGTVADVDPLDELQLCVEVKDVDTAFDGTGEECGTAVAYSGSGVTATVTVSSLSSGTSYHWRVRTKDLSGLYSSWAAFGGNSDTVTAATDFSITSPNLAPESPADLAQTKTDTSAIATGAWTNESSVRFVATVEDGDASDTLYLCIEIKPVADAFTNTETSCGSGVAYSGSPVTATHTVSSLVSGTAYHWQARVKDAAGAYSGWETFGGNSDVITAATDVRIDTAAPTVGSVFDGSVVGVDASFNAGELDELSANWSGFSDSASGIDSYSYSIGTTPGGTELLGWTSESGTAITATSLTLRTNQSYYVNVRAVDVAGNVSTVVSSNGQFVAPTLQFSVSASSLIFDSLASGNSFTDSKSVTLTTSTNGYGGYEIRAAATSAELTGPNGSISAYGSSYDSPTAWSGTGFGYTSNDSSIGGSDVFGSETKYAAFTTSGPGDVVADHASGIEGAPINSESFVITMRVTSPATQRAGMYGTTLRFSATVPY